MKTKTKKCGVYAAMAAVLLITAALITSCPPPIGELTGAPRQVGVSVSLGGDYAKTVMPAAGTIATSAYTGGFTISAYETATPANTLAFSGGPTYANEAALKAAVATTVAVGTNYTIEVEAFIGTVLTTKGINTFVGASGAQTVPITLKPVITTGGFGSFEWNLTYAGGASFATLTTATLEVDTTPPISVNLKTDGNTGTWATTVPTGVYNLTLTLAASDCPTLVYPDVVHIYNTLTTSFGVVAKPAATPPVAAAAKNFPALIETPTWEVVFYNIAANSTDSETVEYAHGEEIKNTAYLAVTPALPTGETVPPPPLEEGDFLGWFTADGGSVLFPLATGHIFGNRNLYGSWVTTPGTRPGTITFGLPQDSGTSLSLGTIAISHSSIDTVPHDENTEEITITITGFTSPQISIGGKTVPAVVGTNTIIIGYGGTDGTTAPNLDGVLWEGNTIVLTVTALSGTVRYSNVLLITIGS